MATLTGTRVELPDERFDTEEDFMEQLSENLKAAGLLEEHFYVCDLREERVEGEPMVRAEAFSYEDDSKPAFLIPGFLPAEWE